MRAVRMCLITCLMAGMNLTRSSSRDRNGEHRAALAALEPAAGLKVDLFASDPLFFNPVAFSIDEEGRFFIAESHRWKDSVFDLWTKDDRWKLADFSFTQVEEREQFLREEFATNLTLLTKDSEIIRLVEDRDGDGVAESSDVFAEGFNEVTSGTAAGVLASEGNLWFTCIPDLWKLEYDESGEAQNRERLHTGYGVRISVSGHDLHGLVRGPDGRIYFSVGDRGANVRSQEGEQLESVNSGAVFRCEPDGSKLELFATGLRNPQDLAFDDLGNLWTHDNDTSGEDPPRVLHIVEGADYGWRQSYQFMPQFGPWVREKIWEGELDGVLPSAGFGAQGPAGLAAYPGVGLPEKYKGALLACDFPQGVWAYFFTPQGATYELRKERFLWALGPTDVDFGPEGDVYISDWGRSYSMPNGGRLLRVTGEADSESAAESKSLLSGGIRKATSENLAQLLAHADRRIRMAAQFELEEREETERLYAAAQDGSSRIARIHGIWGLGNLGRRELAITANYLLRLAEDPDAEIRAQAAKQLGEIPANEKSMNRLVDLLRDESPRVQMCAALSLGRAKMAGQRVTAGLLDLAARSAARHPFLRHAMVYALTRSGDPAAIAAAGRSDNPAVRRVGVLGWRRLKSAELGRFLGDPDPAVRRDAARAINDVPIPGAFAELAARLDSTEDDPQILLRAINANFRLGDGSEWQRVLRFAGKAEAEEDLRVAAVKALADWAAPGPLDPVMGLWRPILSQRAEADLEKLAEMIDRLLDSSSVPVAEAALECVEKLKLETLGPRLARTVADQSRPAALRVRALHVLGGLGSKALGESVALALTDTNSALRAEAVSWLPEVESARALMLIEEILNSGNDLRMQQSALGAAARMSDPAVEHFLAGQLELLAAGKINPGLQLDLIEAARARKDSDITAKLRTYEAGTNGGGSLAPFQWALAGGNAAIGKTIFFERDALGCVRCHAVGGRGGTVGPDLARIASRRDRTYLLESIVHPNAQVTTGYESVAVSLKDGRSFAGTVKSDDGIKMVIHSAEDGLVTIRHDELERRQRTLSAMPEGLTGLMEPRELRDLIEYLASLQ